MSLMEAIGDALIVEPWLATVGLGAQLVARAGNPAQKAHMLPRIAEGSLKLAFAHDEAQTRHEATGIASRGDRASGGHLVSGAKRGVPGGASADTLVVSFQCDAGMALALVDPTARGVSVTPLRMLDGTRAADVVLDGVHVDDDALIGTPGAALPVIEDVLDFATALVCAEAVGAIASANATTLEYLKTRQQFGVPIGSFQALQHRMVDLAIELEQARSMAALACSAVDHEADRRVRARTVSAAKVRIADACRRVSQESIQLHGGMGMSDEMKVSHTFRRLTVIAQQFGDADHHLARFAALDAKERA
jgi:alkylation response protein AidB-like acyl-CoA dehydrogenase